MPTIRLHADALTAAAQAKGDMTSYAIAKRTGLSQDTIGRLRRGIAEPTVSSLVILARAYGLAVGDLVDADADEQAKESA